MFLPYIDFVDFVHEAHMQRGFQEKVIPAGSEAVGWAASAHHQVVIRHWLLVPTLGGHGVPTLRIAVGDDLASLGCAAASLFIASAA